MSGINPCKGAPQANKREASLPSAERKGAGAKKAEKRKIGIFSPAVSPPQKIRQGREYDLQQIKLMRSLDRRVVVDDRVFPDFFSAEDVDATASLTTKLVQAVHHVEEKIAQDWGARKVFKEISVVVPSPQNNATTECEGILELILGLPKQYLAEFTFPNVVLAHEYGHYLACEDRNGMMDLISCDFKKREKVKRSEYEKWRKTLDSHGNQPNQYYGSIPYGIFPRGLFVPKGCGHEFFYFINELVADKASLQIVGYEEASKEAENKIHVRIASDNPWLLMQAYVLARYYGYSSEGKTLAEKIKLYENLWADTISTNDLLEKLFAFFQQTSLKHQ